MTHGPPRSQSALYPENILLLNAGAAPAGLALVHVDTFIAGGCAGSTAR